MAVRGLDHVVLDVRPEPVLRAKNRGEPRIRQRRQAVGDVPEPGIDRRGIADNPHPPAVQSLRGQEAVASKNQRHFRIIGAGALASQRGALIDYPPLVVSPACFARAESRSSLKSDSLPPCEFSSSRRAAATVFGTLTSRHARWRPGSNEE